MHRFFYANDNFTRKYAGWDKKCLAIIPNRIYNKLGILARGCLFNKLYNYRIF